MSLAAADEQITLINIPLNEFPLISPTDSFAKSGSQISSPFFSGCPMPIQVECPECGKRFRFADSRAGESTDCKACGAEIEIPGGRGRGGKKRKKKSDSSAGPMLAIGGAIAAVAIVGGIAFMSMGRGQPAAVANNPGAGNPAQSLAANSLVPPASGNTPGSNPAAGAPATTTLNPAVQTPPLQPTIPNPAVPPQTANAIPPAGGNPSAAGSGFKQKKDTEGFKPVKDWKVQVDPLAQPLEIGDASKFSIKTVDGFLQQDFVVYPNTPSPFVVVGKNMSNKDTREVWNLATGSKTGTIKGPQITGRTVGFSPDGNFIAWFRHEGGGGGIEVYDVKAKKSLGAVPVDSNQFNVAQVCLPTSKRLVGLSNVHRGILTWKLPSGELEWQIKLGQNGQPEPRFAFSPGGRFLAVVADFLTKAIDIYDLDNGQKAGAIEFVDRGPDLLGMAFSNDGSELAGAYGTPFSEKSERIVIWNVADGSIRDDFELPNPDQRSHDMLNSKTSIQWFPDGRRLLLNGMYVVDREARDVVYAFPKQSFDFPTGLTRKVLSNTTIVSWDGSPKSAVITPLEVKSEDIAHAREVAAAGGLLIDAKLPRLTPFKRDKAVDRSATSPNWQAAVDPGSGTSQFEGKLSFKSDNSHVQELKFSGPAAAIACLRHADAGEDSSGPARNLMPQMNHIMRNNRSRLRTRTPPPLCQTNWLEMYDLAKGAAAGRIDPGFPCELLAVSPDGSRVLVQVMAGEGRLDVFAADGSHVAACRPFLDDGEKLQHEVASAIFIDANTVAATSMNDRLVVFRLPACEPLYGADDAALVTLSPGGKFLATCDNNRVDLRDSRTGESRGSATLDGSIIALSFSTAGDRLAALVTGRAGNAIAVINMADGSQTSVPIPQAAAPMLWCGDNELLVGGQSPVADYGSSRRGASLDYSLMLVDLQRKAVLWSYLYGHQEDVTFGRDTFDGRLWIAGTKAKGKGGQITAVSLPEPATRKLMTDQKMEAQTIVRPGMSVSLKFDVTSPPGIEGYAKKARDLVDAAIRSNELTVKDGSPIQLTIQIAPANVSGTMQLQSLGAGTPQQNITVQRKGVTVRFAYETGGKAIWGASYDVSNEFFGLTRLPQGKDVQTVLDENMWQRALSILETNPPPSHVFAPELARGLGTSRLTGDGTQSAGK